MNIETKLARVFTALAGDEKRTESTASAVLTIVKAAGITKVEDFNVAVQAAYEANGWNQKPGRPVAGSTADSVPDTVRTYVSWVRAAFAAGLRVARFKTFQELRKALAKRRAPTAASAPRGAGSGDVKVPESIVESFRGVHVEDAKPNGGLFHDLALVYIKLSESERGLFGRQLNQLLGKYRAQAFPATKLKKAA